MGGGGPKTSCVCATCRRMKYVEAEAGQNNSNNIPRRRKTFVSSDAREESERDEAILTNCSSPASFLPHWEKKI